MVRISTWQAFAPVGKPLDATLFDPLAVDALRLDLADPAASLILSVLRIIPVEQMLMPAEPPRRGGLGQVSQVANFAAAGCVGLLLWGWSAERFEDRQDRAAPLSEAFIQRHAAAPALKGPPRAQASAPTVSHIRIKTEARHAPSSRGIPSPSFTASAPAQVAAVRAGFGQPQAQAPDLPPASERNSAQVLPQFALQMRRSSVLTATEAVEAVPRPSQAASPAAALVTRVQSDREVLGAGALGAASSSAGALDDLRERSVPAFGIR